MLEKSNSQNKLITRKKNKSQVLPLLNLYPQKNTKETIYPEWLKTRADFQKTMQIFKEIDHKDISIIIKKNQKEWSPYEKHTLINWIKSIEFFSKMTVPKIKGLIGSFNIECIEKGQNIAKSSLKKFLYIIAGGELLLDYSNNKETITSKNVMTESGLLNSFIFPNTTIFCYHKK